MSRIRRTLIIATAAFYRPAFAQVPTVLEIDT